MFHSTGLNNLPWRSSHISEPLDIIRDKFEVIKEDGYKSIFMREAAAHMGQKRDRLVHLNFDDGYLDNWVHIFPLLVKYDLKATIYVTAEFVDPKDIVREQRISFEREHDSVNCCAGFLSYSEMREMEATGLVEIQSHSLTHTWYFKGPEIVDFWHPGAATRPLGPVWMLWNNFPEQKPFYLTEAAELEKRIPYGTPIYEHGKSLETLKFFPDEGKLEDKLIDLAGSKNIDFYRNDSWRDEFHRLVREYHKEHDATGKYESREEYNERIAVELSESKRRLEEGLGHPIDGICWPGGGITEDVTQMAKMSGYRYFTLPSAWRGRKGNGYFGEMIPRIGSLPRVALKKTD
ncbi:MAG: polysaccharide deacetylase family protein, partial [Candidatus Krumholzibacteria bacterium]|nr:polysaccharide deacetylase family protein [Candidatus Krumholzibacteria bacterium]